MSQELARWLDLAEDVARRHRRGQVLAVDPALVLRGLPPHFRPARGAGGPGDDVVALAGAALAHLPPEVDPALRAVLVEAAAGCAGADLPGLVRRVRPTLAALPSPPADPGAGPPADPGTDAGRHATAGSDRRRGQHLARVGALATAALALAGTVGAITARQAGSGPGQRLGPEPTEVRAGVSVAWLPPHLLVEAGGIRYRYRIDGPVEAVAVAGPADAPALVAVGGRDRWPLAVPALDRPPAETTRPRAGPALSGTGGPRSAWAAPCGRRPPRPGRRWRRWGPRGPC